jgi:hypothetical protein
MRTALLAVSLVLATTTARADGTDFGPQVRMMFRVAACGGDDAVPDRFGAKLVDSHCSELRAVYKAYKKAWADPAQSFIAELRPQTLTTTVVYPFGGGDLSSALSVFPDATELTTISLEAGSINRRIHRRRRCRPPRTISCRARS